jgi:general secretion pathway protein I
MTHGRAAGGFTLIEVLVALAIVALGMSALMSALTSAADATSHLRYKSLAEWVALNRVAEQRLAKVFASEGKVDGTTELGGLRWRWTQTVSPAGYGTLMRIDVTVSLDPASGGTKDAQLAEAAGFWSNSVQPNLGTGVAGSIDWDGAAWIQSEKDKQQQQQQQQQPQPQPPGSVPPLSNPASRQ